MKKNMYVLLGALLTTAVLTGCGEQPTVEDSGIVASRPSEEIEESTEGKTELEELEGSEVVIVPTKFEVFTDGEPHYLMYHATTEHTYWNTFTSLSKPELGIESVSFLSQFVDLGEDVRICVDDALDWGNDIETPCDMTTMSFIEDDGYYILIPGDGVCGIISREIPMQGSEPTDEEIKSMVEIYGMYSYDEIFSDISEDGEQLYSSYCHVPMGPNDYYGGYSFRVKDGKAEGVFLAFHGEEMKDNSGHVRYMIQSLRFVK